MKLGGHWLVVYNPVDPDADRLWDADAERFGSPGIDRSSYVVGCSIGMSPALVPRMIFDPLRLVEHARQAGVKREFGN